MRLGDVLRKEREHRKLSIEETSSTLGVSEEEYRQIEAGETPAEIWGPVLAQIAIQLETSTARLLADSGRAADRRPVQIEALIRKQRELRGRSAPELAKTLGISEEEYAVLEAGTSALEVYGPLFRAFAEAIEQPVFNLFYPCGVPFQELNDYP